MNAVQNRILAALITATLVPWLERETGAKLTDDQVAGLVALGPVAYHCVAIIGTKLADIGNRIIDKYLPPHQPADPAQTKV